MAGAYKTKAKATKDWLRRLSATYRVPNGQGERINRSYALPEAKRNGKSMEGTTTTTTTTRNSDKKRKANPLRVKIIP